MGSAMKTVKKKRGKNSYALASSAAASNVSPATSSGTSSSSSWAVLSLLSAPAAGACFWNCSAILLRLSKLSGPEKRIMPFEWLSLLSNQLSILQMTGWAAPISKGGPLHIQCPWKNHLSKCLCKIWLVICNHINCRFIPIYHTPWNHLIDVGPLVLS